MMKFDVYQNKNSILHKIDPRVKIISLLELLVFVFLPLNFYLLFILSILIIIFSLIEVGAKPTFTVFKSILPILIIMTLFSPLYKDDLTPILVIGNFPVLYHAGIAELLTIGSRFILITFGFSLLLTSTKQKLILLALKDFNLSFNASLQVSLILNFLPQLASTFLLIRDSHKLRQNGKKLSKIAQILPNLISTFVIAIKTIPLTAMALELRGFGRKNKRTNYEELPSKVKIIFPSILSTSFFIILGLIFFK